MFPEIFQRIFHMIYEDPWRSIFFSFGIFHQPAASDFDHFLTKDQSDIGGGSGQRQRGRASAGRRALDVAGLELLLTGSMSGEHGNTKVVAVKSCQIHHLCVNSVLNVLNSCSITSNSMLLQYHWRPRVLLITSLDLLFFFWAPINLLFWLRRNHHSFRRFCPT